MSKNSEMIRASITVSLGVRPSIDALQASHIQFRAKNIIISAVLHSPWEDKCFMEGK